MTSPLLPYWFWHAISGTVGLLLIVAISVTGAMLRGRLQRLSGVNVFRVHRAAGIAFVPVMLLAYLHGQYITADVGFGLPHTAHGWVGLALVVLGLIQVIPSVTIRARKRLRLQHMLSGWLTALLLLLQVLWGLQIGLSGHLKPLVLLHSIGGGIAAGAFVLILYQLSRGAGGTLPGIRNAALVAAAANIAGCWIAGGYSYLTNYGSVVKPAIVASSATWAHHVLVETKEHVFIFLPVLSLLLLLVTNTAAGRADLAEEPELRRCMLLITIVALSMVGLMFVFGAIISSAGRIGGAGV